MSVGTPVMITKTEGFWDPINFINNKNIHLIEKNEVEVWKQNINRFFEEKKEMEKVKIEGIELVSEKFNLNYFNHKLEEIIFKK
jgi:glycosyltransferase involved in cell wall biosynthesis